MSSNPPNPFANTNTGNIFQLASKQNTPQGINLFPSAQIPDLKTISNPQIGPNSVPDQPKTSTNISTQPQIKKDEKKGNPFLQVNKQPQQKLSTSNNIFGNNSNLNTQENKSLFTGFITNNPSQRTGSNQQQQKKISFSFNTSQKPSNLMKTNQIVTDQTNPTYSNNIFNTKSNSTPLNFIFGNKQAAQGIFKVASNTPSLFLSTNKVQTNSQLDQKKQSFSLTGNKDQQSKANLPFLSSKPLNQIQRQRSKECQAQKGGVFVLMKKQNENEKKWLQALTKDTEGNEVKSKTVFNLFNQASVNKHKNQAQVLMNKKPQNFSLFNLSQKKQNQEKEKQKVRGNDDKLKVRGNDDKLKVRGNDDKLKVRGNDKQALEDKKQEILGCLRKMKQKGEELYLTSNQVLLNQQTQTQFQSKYSKLTQQNNQLNAKLLSQKQDYEQKKTSSLQLQKNNSTLNQFQAIIDTKNSKQPSQIYPSQSDIHQSMQSMVSHLKEYFLLQNSKNITNPQIQLNNLFNSCIKSKQTSKQLLKKQQQLTSINLTQSKNLTHQLIQNQHILHSPYSSSLRSSKIHFTSQKMKESYDFDSNKIMYQKLREKNMKKVHQIQGDKQEQKKNKPGSKISEGRTSMIMKSIIME